MSAPTKEQIQELVKAARLAQNVLDLRAMVSPIPSYSTSQKLQDALKPFEEPPPDVAASVEERLILIEDHGQHLTRRINILSKERASFDSVRQLTNRINNAEERLDRYARTIDQLGDAINRMRR